MRKVKILDATTSFFVLLFLIFVGVQIFVDAAFVFLCYLTGVLVLKVIRFVNTKYELLNYRVFKTTYRTEPSYRRPIALGTLIWISFLLILMAIQ